MATTAQPPKIVVTLPAALRKKWAAWCRAGQDAYALVKGGGLEPSESQGSWISRAFKKIGLG